VRVVSLLGLGEDGQTGGVRRVRFSELFGAGKDTLFLYNFMFKPGERGLPLEVPCPLCTSIIDGIDEAVWPLWSVLDRTAEGRGSDWLPQLQYP
jgi:predicted dithiol-disulfide oxidoreductase (DUF899 family)